MEKQTVEVSLRELEAIRASWCSLDSTVSVIGKADLGDQARTVSDMIAPAVQKLGAILEELDREGAAA